MYVVPSEVLLVYQMSGVLPLLCTPETSRRFQNIAFSQTLSIYGLMVVTVQTVSTYWGLYVDYKAHLDGLTPIRMYSKTSVFSNSLDIVSLNLLVIILYISCARRYSKFIEMCHILDRVDLYLKKNICERKTTLKIVLLAIHMALLFTAAAVYELWEYRKTHNDYVVAIYFLYFPIGYTIVLGLVINFTFTAWSISKRFRIVNNEFENEISKCLHFGKEDLWHLPKNITTTNRHNFPSTTKIKELIDMYWLLCDAVKEANAFYSSQLLAAITTFFLQIIISTYYLFRDIWPAVTTEKVIHAILEVDFVLTHCFNLILIVWSSTDVTNAAEETGYVICNLMGKDISTEMRMQLESFLLQIPHRNTKFSALGFFQVHNHILPTIAGSVTTFLVILIQFHMASSRQT